MARTAFPSTFTTVHTAEVAVGWPGIAATTMGADAFWELLGCSTGTAPRPSLLIPACVQNRLLGQRHPLYFGSSITSSTRSRGCFSLLVGWPWTPVVDPKALFARGSSTHFEERLRVLVLIDGPKPPSPNLNSAPLTAVPRDFTGPF